MSANEYLSYCELRAKEVVNSCDGKRMGRISDILFSRENGAVCGIVVPVGKRCGIFCKTEELFVPWSCVQKIGADVILVNVSIEPDGRIVCKKEQNGRHGKKNCGDTDGCFKQNECSHYNAGEQDCAAQHPDCDNRCEKCMLFDCVYRWSHTNL